MSQFRMPRRRSPGGSSRSRGQSLVEFALLLPVLLLLVLAALDFGRLFLGWITLNNMARVGADYAAKHPDAWANGNTLQTDEYIALIRASYDSINCEPTTPDPAPPVFSGQRQPGDQVSVALQCDFRPLTPIIRELFFQQPIPIGATAAFPVTYGCIGECSPGAGGPPPPPPDNCRTVPDMVGMSVLGARNAWVAAGFSAGNLNPGNPDDDVRTVDDQTVQEPPNDEGCSGSERFVFSTVTLGLAPRVEPDPPVPGCVWVPQLVGMTVSQARDVWANTGLGSFVPDSGAGDRIVTDLFTTPDVAPDECVLPPVDVQVTYGAALADPPPQPCQVPSFANTASGDAQADWDEHGFSGPITFKNPNRLPYTIQSQSLTGGAYVLCTSGITLSNTGNANP